MATIKDVARLAGVGLGTASRAISGRGAVAKDTRQRVEAAALALGFQPSNVARALSLKTMGMVGLYLPYFEGPFFGPILSVVDAELRSVGRHMVAANGCGQGDRRQQAIDGVEFLIRRECDGVLVLSGDLEDTDFAALSRHAKPLVVLNRNVASMAAYCFTTDHEQAGRLAARALLERGHRDIATICGPRTAPDNHARMQGFRDELAQHGVRIRRDRQIQGDFSMQSGALGARDLLGPDRRGYSALFCANDEMAIGAISVFARAGMRIPADLSVIGFDGSAASAYTTPALTTVLVPIENVAANACRLLLDLCYGLALPVQREFPAGVVWRESVGDGPHAPIVPDRPIGV